MPKPSVAEPSRLTEVRARALRLSTGDIVRIGDLPYEGQQEEEWAEFASYIGRLGVVTAIFGRLPSWRVGESLRDPFIYVRFADKTTDGFWREELEVVKAIDG